MRSIIHDPSLVMLGFKQAYRYARTPAERRSVARAARRWRDDATPPMMVRGMPDHLGAAVAAACRYNVGALYIAAVGDTAVSVTKATLEEEQGADLTSNQERLIEEAKTLGGQRASEETWSEWLRRNASDADAALKGAVTQAYNDARAGADALARQVTDIPAEVVRQAVKPAQTVANTGAVLAIGVLALGAYFLLSNRSR